ncbi:TonB-dependent receptor family protein [Nannocystis punicea]|uniref:TonB-dependent receptor n=1 Tax=Nannocystis punicea TaxID=2995304 RepID=A0ABY7HF71_9BACT|nr:TonB-dependent receptor [Nannocystis poenicansa]WAS97730.1 TonB-dependent receptor [Nannocystis poenicansa]
MSSLALHLALLLAADPRAYEGPDAAPDVPAPEDRPDWTFSKGPAPESMPEEPAAVGAVEPAGASGGGPVSAPPAATGGTKLLPGESRDIEVTTDLLGRSTRVDAHRHAGGRQVVDVDQSKAEGASGVAELLDKVPGVRAVEGASGLGTSATKLNLAVRGADPRLSEQATILLDEVPVAPAPYGAPSMVLFPLSLFQIARVDTVRGGSSVRFGPWTSGGVFNMVSHPIPKNPTVSVFAQSDQFGDAGAAASYGGTHKGIGVYVEYAPRFGKTYREHSEFQSHGGILKLAVPVTKRLELLSSTHLFWEKTNLPGGVDSELYAEDRFASKRPYDTFNGHREGTSLKLHWRPKAEHELQVIAFYSHTLRRVVQATNEDRNLGAASTFLLVQPRAFDVVGIEPRYAFRVRHRGGFHDLSIGTRGVFETARIRGFRVEFPERPGDPLQADGDSRVCPRGTILPEGSPNALRCFDGRIGGYSLYLEDKMYLLDTKLVLTAGVRLELTKQSFYNVLEGLSYPRPLYGGPLPAASLWYGGDHVGLYLGYGRSFGAPSYLSGAIQPINPGEAMGRALRFIKPELADTVEAGVKLMELGGVYATVDGWYRYFNNLRDEGENAIDIIPAAHTYGAEVDLEWLPGEVWEKVDGLELNVGYAYNGSRVLRDLYTGNRMPWYPAHEVWGSASYEAPFGLRVGTKVEFVDKQYTDYANWDAPRATGEVGTMPAYTLMGAWLGYRTGLPSGWRLEATVGVKNLLNEVWFTRSDDINGGILAMRPRTFYFNLGFAHEWIRGKAGEQARTSWKRGKVNRRVWTAGVRRIERWFWRTWGALM